MTDPALLSLWSESGASQSRCGTGVERRVLTPTRSHTSGLGMLLCAVLPWVGHGPRLLTCVILSEEPELQTDPVLPSTARQLPGLPSRSSRNLSCATSPADLTGSEQEERSGGLEGGEEHVCGLVLPLEG